MELTNEQEGALRAIREWFARRDRPWFYLAGYAGTGKTTLAQFAAEAIGGRVEFGAPTGKAAQVLRRKGCDGATTIHRLIYQVQGKSRLTLEELEAKLEQTKAQAGIAPPKMRAAVIELEKQIREEKARLSQPAFGIHPDAQLRGARLLVLDECSMVDDYLARDILSLGVPVLALGDPAQLPPVRGSGFFSAREPDALLTDVRRQALDSPVLALATAVRRGAALERGRYGSSEVTRFKDMDADQARAAGVILTGHNRTRRAFNTRLRTMAGHDAPYPVKGEPLIALNNRHELGIYNGTTLEARSDALLHGSDLQVQVAGEDVAELTVRSSTFAFDRHRDENLEDGRAFWDKAALVELDWAYALTVHKSQGSQWNDVLVADDGFAHGKHTQRRRWLYTAITRAVDRVTVALRMP